MVGFGGPPGVTELQPRAAVARSGNLQTSVGLLPRGAGHPDAPLSLPRSSSPSSRPAAWLDDETMKAAAATLDLTI